MKKMLYFIPAVLFAVMYLLLIALGFKITFRQSVWLAMFLLSGVLLSKGRLWGGAFGLLPAAEFMYMSTRHTGQVIDIEFPLGAALAVYYIVCGIAVYRKQREG